MGIVPRRAMEEAAAMLSQAYSAHNSSNLLAARRPRRPEAGRSLNNLNNHPCSWPVLTGGGSAVMPEDMPMRRLLFSLVFMVLSVGNGLVSAAAQLDPTRWEKQPSS